MADKGSSKGEPTLSARIPKQTFREFDSMAKKVGCTRSALLRKVCADATSNQYAMAKGGALDSGVIDFSKFEIEREMMDMLVSVGAGTGAGFLGYKIAQFIRTRYTDNNNDGIELGVGLCLGLLGFLGTLNYMGKPKK